MKKLRDAQTADKSEKKNRGCKATVHSKEICPAPDSEPGKTANPDSRSSQSAGKKPTPNLPPPQGWGNIIVIEHHLPDDTYVTSIYGPFRQQAAGQQRRHCPRRPGDRLRRKAGAEKRRL